MWDEELFFYWLRSQVKAAGTGPSIAHPNKFCFLEENTMKKHDMMKKFTAAALSLTMMAGLDACSGGSSSGVKFATDTNTPGSITAMRNAEYFRMRISDAKYAFSE